MRYRKLSTGKVVDGKYVAEGDYVFGHGKSDFWIDSPDGVAQHVVTRLRLQYGEWFLDLEEGTPWKTRVLGKHTANTRDMVIRYRTLDTQGVRNILDYSSHLDRETRGFGVNILLDTIYGVARLQEPI
jgi:hypothetical protein